MTGRGGLGVYRGQLRWRRRQHWFRLWEHGVCKAVTCTCVIAEVTHAVSWYFTTVENAAGCSLLFHYFEVELGLG